jgi:hypothetical protein
VSPVRVEPEPWGEAKIESLAARVDLCGRAISELGARFEASAARATRLAAALRSAGQALAFIDDDDGDAASGVIERLELLEREADGLLTLWQDDVTRLYPASLRWQPSPPRDDEATRVRPRIVPPARAFGHRSRARGT